MSDSLSYIGNKFFFFYIFSLFVLFIESARQNLKFKLKFSEFKHGFSYNVSCLSYLEET